MGKCTQKRATRSVRKNIKPRQRVAAVSHHDGLNRAQRREIERLREARATIAAQDAALLEISLQPRTPRQYPLASMHDLFGMRRAALKRARRTGDWSSYRERDGEYSIRAAARILGS